MSFWISTNCNSNYYIIIMPVSIVEKGM